MYGCSHVSITLRPLRQKKTQVSRDMGKEEKLLELNQCNILQFSIVVKRMFVVNPTL